MPSQHAAPREIDRPRLALGPFPAELDDALGKSRRNPCTGCTSRAKAGGRIQGVHAASRRTIVRPHDLCRRLHQAMRFGTRTTPRPNSPNIAPAGHKIAAPEPPGHELQGEDRRQHRRRQSGQLKRRRTEGKQVLSDKRLEGRCPSGRAQPTKRRRRDRASGRPRTSIPRTSSENGSTKPTRGKANTAATRTAMSMTYLVCPSGRLSRRPGDMPRSVGMAPATSAGDWCAARSAARDGENSPTAFPAGRPSRRRTGPASMSSDHDQRRPKRAR